MEKKPDRSTKDTPLRRKAEERLRATRHDVASMPGKDVQQLVYELQVHQIELEMQNDELRRAQVELEVARDAMRILTISPTGHLHCWIITLQDYRGQSGGQDVVEGKPERLIRQSLRASLRRRMRHLSPALSGGLEDRHTAILPVHLWDGAGVSRWVHFEALQFMICRGTSPIGGHQLLDVGDRKRAEKGWNSAGGAIIGSAMMPSSRWMRGAWCSSTELQNACFSAKLPWTDDHSTGSSRNGSHRRTRVTEYLRQIKQCPPLDGARGHVIQPASQRRRISFRGFLSHVRVETRTSSPLFYAISQAEGCGGGTADQRRLCPRVLDSLLCLSACWTRTG